MEIGGFWGISGERGLGASAGIMSMAHLTRIGFGGICRERGFGHQRGYGVWEHLREIELEWHLWRGDRGFRGILLRMGVKGASAGIWEFGVIVENRVPGYLRGRRFWGICEIGGLGTSAGYTSMGYLQGI